MTGEWRTVTIEEIAERVAMGPFGSSIKVETFVPSGVPIISGQHLQGFKLDETPGFNFITEEHADRLKNANVQRGDIIFTHAGNIGQVAYVPENSKYDRYVISQRQFYMRPNRSRVIPEFVVSYFKTAEGQHKLLANTSQVGVPSIAQPVTYLRSIEIPLPPLPEQRGIAHILGTLDDKIELNRRMNETLEEMAQAIFKSWFVDFLPVRAKMAAKENDPSLLLPQAESGTWYVYAIECNNGSFYIGQTEDLRQRWLQHIGGKGARWTKRNQPVRVSYWEKQPSREAAVEREQWLKTGLGRKWLKKQIDASARTQTGDPVRAKIEGRLPAPSEARQAGWRKGQSLPGLPAHLWDLFPDRLVDSELGKIPEGWEVCALTETIVVNPPRSLRKNEIAPYLHMANMPTSGHIPNAISDRPFSSGTRFINGDTLLARITPCLENGKTAFVDFLKDGQVGWGSTEFIVLRPKPPLPPEFGYCLARDPEFREFAIQSMTGTSGRQRVPPDALSHYQLVNPPEALGREFGKIVAPLFSRASETNGESRTLATLRDTLLHKLISGKIRVKDAERFLWKRGL